jgi:hypothetical protein
VAASLALEPRNHDLRHPLMIYQKGYTSRKLLFRIYLTCYISIDDIPVVDVEDYWLWNRENSVAWNSRQLGQFVKRAESGSSRLRPGMAHTAFTSCQKLPLALAPISRLGASSANTFLRLLDYLRLSIIIMILSRSSKEELVDLIDDALLDSAKHQELQSRVSDANDLVGA